MPEYWASAPKRTFAPLLPFSAFPFVAPSHWTSNPFAMKACCTRFWTFSVLIFTAMSAYFVPNDVPPLAQACTDARDYETSLGKPPIVDRSLGLGIPRPGPGRMPVGGSSSGPQEESRTAPPVWERSH